MAEAPNRPALLVDEGVLTYAELDAEVRIVAAMLGAGPGEIIPIGLPPGLEFTAHFHAAQRLGAVAAPTDPRATAPPPSGPRLDESLGNGQLDGVGAAVRLLTSGTAGVPRAVDLSRANFEASAAGTGAALAVTAEDRWLCCLPTHHVGGLSILTRSAIWGTCAVVHRSFDIDRVAASLAEDGVTLVSLVATQLIRLLAAGANLSGPRAIVVGGGPVPPEILAEANGLGATVTQTYGMTETCSQVTMLDPADAARCAGSAGRAVPGAELTVAEDEIRVRGAMVAPGSVDDDGWLRTGDLGQIDAEGMLWVRGRADDLIVTGGENVDPEVVERALLAHPDVEDVAVVGRDDPAWQQAVTAVVVLRAGAEASAADLGAHCEGQLSRHEIPKRFEFAGELPRTSGGKLRRAALRGPH